MENDEEKDDEWDGEKKAGFFQYCDAVKEYPSRMETRVGVITNTVLGSIIKGDDDDVLSLCGCRCGTVKALLFAANMIFTTFQCVSSSMDTVEVVPSSSHFTSTRVSSNRSDPCTCTTVPTRV